MKILKNIYEFLAISFSIIAMIAMATYTFVFKRASFEKMFKDEIDRCDSYDL
jgi:hypothetical protein